ncbi:MAG: PA2779 family protein [Thermoanaerobaculia bacterium]
MRAILPRLLIPSLLLTLLVVAGAPLVALQSPSKTEPEQSVADREIELAKIQAVVSQPEIAQILTHHGLSTAEAHQRLAQLSPEEIHTLMTQVDQIQAAGAAVPKYIWILLAALLGVLILTALF